MLDTIAKNKYMYDVGGEGGMMMRRKERKLLGGGRLFEN
jgi:hypothetical protein